MPSWVRNFPTQPKTNNIQIAVANFYKSLNKIHCKGYLKTMNICKKDSKIIVHGQSNQSRCSFNLIAEHNLNQVRFRFWAKNVQKHLSKSLRRHRWRWRSDHYPLFVTFSSAAQLKNIDIGVVSRPTKLVKFHNWISRPKKDLFKQV